MKEAKRITINTAAQYVKTLISIVLGFYSTRFILQGLGESDFGIYSLLAGIVGMLSFIVNALALTTQRYLSYNQGAGNTTFLKELFFNSLFVHVILSIICLIILEITGMFLIGHWLSIPPDRIHAANIVLHCAIIMLVLSILNSPFRALLISHENMVFTSIVDVIDAILKVIIAIIVLDSDSDQLILFSALMCGVNLFTLMACSIYDKIKYNEFAIIGLKNIKWSIIRPMATFAGWSLYSTFCIIGRSQGSAIVINHICGTIANAAYGVAIQVSAAVNYLSSSLLNAISPPLIKAEGSGKRDLMLLLAFSASKFSFALISIVIVPIYFYINPLLKMWLTDVPEYTNYFIIIILTSSLFDSLSTGLSLSNKAIGNLKWYALTVDSLKLIAVPVFFICCKAGLSIIVAFWSYAVFEGISAIVRVHLMYSDTGCSPNRWLTDVVLPLSIPFTMLVVAYFLTSLITFNLYIIIPVSLIITTIYIFAFVKLSTNDFEKKQIKKLITRTNIPLLKL